jgi:hypothetical protein
MLRSFLRPLRKEDGVRPKETRFTEKNFDSASSKSTSMSLTWAAILVERLVLWREIINEIPPAMSNVAWESRIDVTSRQQSSEGRSIAVKANHKPSARAQSPIKKATEMHAFKTISGIGACDFIDKVLCHAEAMAQAVPKARFTSGLAAETRFMVSEKELYVPPVRIRVAP